MKLQNVGKNFPTKMSERDADLEMVSSSSSNESLASSTRSSSRLASRPDMGQLKDTTDKGLTPGSADGGNEPLLNDLKHFTGKHKEWRDFERCEIVFLVLSVGSILVTAGLTIERMSKTYDVQSEQAEFTFALLLLVNTVFVLFYIVHGVLFESFEEMLAFVAGTGIVMLYVIADYSINSKHRNTLKLVRLILVAVFGPILIAMGVYVGKNFRWLEFRVVGAAENMQSMYKMYARFCALLKFDLQLAVSLVILVLRKGSTVNALEISILSIGLLFCFFWAMLGFYAVRKESNNLMYLFNVLSLLEIVYIIFKCVNIVEHWSEYKTDHVEKLAYTLYCVAALAIVVRGILLHVAETVRRDFGHGLQEHLG